MKFIIWILSKNTVIIIEMFISLVGITVILTVDQPLLIILLDLATEVYQLLLLLVCIVSVSSGSILWFYVYLTVISESLLRFCCTFDT